MKFWGLDPPVTVAEGKITPYKSLEIPVRNQKSRTSKPTITLKNEKSRTQNDEVFYPSAVAAPIIREA